MNFLLALGEYTKRVCVRYSKVFTSSSLSCSVTMVQGELGQLTLAHFLLAAKVGFIAAVCYAASMFFIKKDPINLWVGALLTAIFTALSDVLMHPSHFGSWWTEAVITGIGAGALVLVFSLGFIFLIRTRK